ncbi:MAG: aminotransferase class V-fold PLP-dependent enzyme [Rhodobacteraceae bacterium]|nr:MAG: aminotransferase class V-fold PLP-dependent enzyme [Paracoccaceae bacterium]
MTPFDLAFVRGQFPAFAEPSLDGWAFFENAGGSYPCRQTIDRLTAFYARTKVQPYAPYPASEAAGRAMDDARARLAALLNVPGDWLHVGPSTTQNAYVLARAFRAGWREGDEIVVTDQDHEANSGAWRKLAETGIVVREWRVDPETGRLDPAALPDLLGPRTRLVAFPHASNIVAEVNPVAAIAAMVREAGAVSVVDGVSYAPHGLPDVAALGADVYFFSAYKTFGPHQGVMAVRREAADRLEGQGHWFNAGDVAKKLTPAGPDHAQVAALAGVADYVDALHARHFGDGAPPAERARAVHDMIRAREAALLAPLLDWLRGERRARVLGPLDAGRRAPTVALACARPGEAAAADLAAHRIMAGGGDFYAPRVLSAMGVDPGHGVLRVSFLHYTAPEEIERLIAALDAVL